MRAFLLLLTSLVYSLACAQELAQLEDSMTQRHALLGTEATDEEKIQASEELAALMEESFKIDGSFSYPFSKIPRVVKLVSDDQAFRIFSWSVALSDESFQYHMYVLFPNGKYVRFLDRRELNQENEGEEVASDNWYGALYYEVKRVKQKRSSYYVLMGWDGSNQLTTKKVIDVLTTNGKNKASLGYPIFEYEGVLKHRRVFEYASDAQVNLKWLEPKKMIIFDHLEPTAQNLKGQYAFYGPSTTFDGYLWEGDHWKFVENVDMSRPKTDRSDARFNFPERPDFTRQRDKTNPLDGK
jgi:hypothetical protein